MGGPHSFPSAYVQLLMVRVGCLRVERLVSSRRTVLIRDLRVASSLVFNSVGHDKNETPRMENSGRSTDLPASTSNDQTEAQEWTCDFPGCDSKFKSKIGLGAHKNRKHPAWLERQKLEQRPERKARGTVEEKSVLTRREAVLLHTGRLTNTNVSSRLLQIAS